MSHIFHSVITKHSPDLQRPAKSPQPLSREPISLPPPRQDNGNATQVLLLENQFRSTSPTPKCILYYNYNHLDFFPDPKIPKSPVKYILGKQLATSPSPPLGVQINQFQQTTLQVYQAIALKSKSLAPLNLSTLLTSMPMLAIYPNIKLIATWKWFSPIRHQNISHATPGTGLQAPSTISDQKFHTC